MQLIKIISNKMNNYVNRRLMLALFIMIVGVLMVMERLTSGIKDMNLEIPDMMYWGYNDSLLQEFLHTIGAIGRQEYIINLYIDFIFIILFMLFTSLLITYLIIKADIPSSLKYLNLLPFLRSLLDVGENTILVYICKHYPNKFTMLTTICSVLTITKFVVLGIMVIVIVWTGNIILIKKIKMKLKKDKLNCR